MLGDKELRWFASNLNISTLKDKRMKPYRMVSKIEII